MAKAVRTLQDSMEPYAICEDPECEWLHGESRDTRTQAKFHVAQRKHKVIVVTERRDLYVPE